MVRYDNIKHQNLFWKLKDSSGFGWCVFSSWRLSWHKSVVFHLKEDSSAYLWIVFKIFFLKKKIFTCLIECHHLCQMWDSFRIFHVPISLHLAWKCFSLVNLRPKNTCMRPSHNERFYMVCVCVGSFFQCLFMCEVSVRCVALHENVCL